MINDKIRSILCVIIFFAMIPFVLKLTTSIIKEDHQNNPYYYAKGIVEEKYISKGLFGKENHYIKIRLNDSNKVGKVNAEFYLLAEINKEIFLILDKDMKGVKDFKFNEKELNEYINREKLSNRDVILFTY